MYSQQPTSFELFLGYMRLRADARLIIQMREANCSRYVTSICSLGVHHTSFDDVQGYLTRAPVYVARLR